MLERVIWDDCVLDETTRTRPGNDYFVNSDAMIVGAPWVGRAMVRGGGGAGISEARRVACSVRGALKSCVGYGRDGGGRLGGGNAVKI